METELIIIFTRFALIYVREDNEGKQDSYTTCSRHFWLYLPCFRFCTTGAESDQKVMGSIPGRTLIQCLFHPHATRVTHKRPQSSCQKCRWKVTPKAIRTYTLKRVKSEQPADYAVQAQSGNLLGKQAHAQLIMKMLVHSHLSSLNLCGLIPACRLQLVHASCLHFKEKASVGNGPSNIPPESSHARKKQSPSSLWPNAYLVIPAEKLRVCPCTLSHHVSLSCSCSDSSFWNWPHTLCSLLSDHELTLTLRYRRDIIGQVAVKSQQGCRVFYSNSNMPGNTWDTAVCDLSSACVP